MRLELNTDFSAGRHKNQAVPGQALEAAQQLLVIIASRRKGEALLTNSIESVSLAFKGGPFSVTLVSTLVVVGSKGPKWAQVQMTKHELHHSTPFRLGQSVPNPEMLADVLLNRVAEVLEQRRPRKIIA